MDSYGKELTEIAQAIEKTYGISDAMKDASDIVSIINGVNDVVLSLDAKELAARNEEVGKSVVLISYLSCRLIYFESVRLDYGNFPMLCEVAEILDKFQDKKNFNKCVAQLNKIIQVLSALDTKSVKARSGLGYRYLRIFVVLVMYRSSCNAAIVASFILSQILMKVGD